MSFLLELKNKTLLTVIQGDIRDRTVLDTAVEGVSLVIHTACIIDVLGHVEQQTIWDVNVRGKIRLFHEPIQLWHIYRTLLNISLGATKSIPCPDLGDGFSVGNIKTPKMRGVIWDDMGTNVGQPQGWRKQLLGAVGWKRGEACTLCLPSCNNWCSNLWQRGRRGCRAAQSFSFSKPPGHSSFTTTFLFAQKEGWFSKKEVETPLCVTFWCIFSLQAALSEHTGSRRGL